MSDMGGSALSRAYELIEAGSPQQARVLLEPLLRDDPQNADAWWVFAHAVDDPEIARDALGHVLEIDPEYAGARELLSALEAQYPARPEAQTKPIRAIGARSVPPVSSLPPIDTLPETETPVRSAAPTPRVDEVRTYEAERRRRFPWPLLAAALAAVAVIALVILLNPPADTTVILPETAVALVETGSSPTLETTSIGVGVPTADASSGVPVFTAEAAFTSEADPLNAAAAQNATLSTEISAVETAGSVVVPQVTPLTALVEADVTTEADINAASSTQGMSPAPLEITAQAEAMNAADTATVSPDAAPTQADVTTEAAIDAVASPTQEVPLEITAQAEGSDATDIATTSLPQETAAAEVTDAGQGGGEDTAALVQTLTPVLALSPEGVSEVETALGNTLIVNVCTTPQTLRADYATALNALASQSELFSPEVDAIGAQLVYCTGGDVPLRRLVVSAQNARDYDSGSLSDADFQSLWRSL